MLTIVCAISPSWQNLKAEDLNYLGAGFAVKTTTQVLFERGLGLSPTSAGVLSTAATLGTVVLWAPMDPSLHGGQVYREMGMGALGGLGAHVVIKFGGW